jgi:hypothetical protein
MIIYFNQKSGDQSNHQLVTFNILIYSVIISSKDSNVIRSILKFSEHPKLSSILFGERIYIVIKLYLKKNTLIILNLEIVNDLIVFSLYKTVETTYNIKDLFVLDFIGNFFL